MVWAIVFITASAILFFLVGIQFMQKIDPGLGFVPLFLALATGAIGTTILYTSGTGNICMPSEMPNQIYTVSGQVETSNGTVAVIEDSKQNVYAVWTGKNKLALPPNAKFVKIDGKIDGSKGDQCLVPVDVPATATPPTSAEKPTEPPATK